MHMLHRGKNLERLKWAMAMRNIGLKTFHWQIMANISPTLPDHTLMNFLGRHFHCIQSDDKSLIVYKVKIVVGFDWLSRDSSFLNVYVFHMRFPKHGKIAKL